MNTTGHNLGRNTTRDPSLVSIFLKPCFLATRRPWCSPSAINRCSNRLSFCRDDLIISQLECHHITPLSCHVSFCSVASSARRHRTGGVVVHMEPSGPRIGCAFRRCSSCCTTTFVVVHGPRARGTAVQRCGSFVRRVAVVFVRPVAVVHDVTGVVRLVTVIVGFVLVFLCRLTSVVLAWCCASSSCRSTGASCHSTHPSRASSCRVCSASSRGCSRPSGSPDASLGCAVPGSCCSVIILRIIVFVLVPSSSLLSAAGTVLPVAAASNVRCAASAFRLAALVQAALLSSYPYSSN